MDKMTLTSLFAETIYQIPDYQRGYAWEEKQWNDFIQDIDALVDEQVISHYTGTVVVYAGRDAKPIDYGIKRLKVKDVVDGQQRLITCCLYLSVILRAFLEKGQSAYEQEIGDFLYSDTICKLKLNNDTEKVYYDLLKYGRPNTPVQSPHEKRLVSAYHRFQSHMETQLKKRGEEAIVYLKNLYFAITQKLHFTFYTIEEECEIGMTFELMNSRGKELSVLELLKNYLMHWVSRNETNLSERANLTALINKNWKDTYTNLGFCDGDEDQCLRVAWILYCSYTPKNWKGYDGFKEDEYIPLRGFKKRTKDQTKEFMIRFVGGLAVLSRHYSNITSPTSTNTLSAGEFLWLTKIHHSGNTANFLPLMVAARIHRESKRIDEEDYIAFLKALECFAYRVFLYGGRRSNAGKSAFYRYADEVFKQTRSLKNIIPKIHALTRYYSHEDIFIQECQSPDDWYGSRRLLKYTLFEYELRLLETEGRGKQPYLRWEDLSESTIGHILPQTPSENSHWKEVWNEADFKNCLHDIGNLVLTQDNSSYSNFEFSRKRGQPGQSPSYSNSDIRQERKIAKFSDWTRKEFDERRTELITWIKERWATVPGASESELEVVDEADEDETEIPGKGSGQ